MTPVQLKLQIQRADDVAFNSAVNSIFTHMVCVRSFECIIAKISTYIHADVIVPPHVFERVIKELRSDGWTVESAETEHESLKVYSQDIKEM